MCSIVDFIVLSIAVVYETLQDCNKIMVSLRFVHANIYVLRNAFNIHTYICISIVVQIKILIKFCSYIN